LQECYELELNGSLTRREGGGKRHHLLPFSYSKQGHACVYAYGIYVLDD